MVGSNVVYWLKYWFKLFWKAFKNPSPTSQHPRILKSWYSSQCAVLSLSRSEKGAVATYRIIPRENAAGFWLLYWDDLLERDTEGFEYDGEAFVLRSHQDFLRHSHSLSVRHITNTGSAQVKEAWDINLKTNQFEGGDKIKAQAVAQNVALHVMKIPATPCESWTQQIERINWLGIVDLYVSKSFGGNHPLRAEARDRN